MTHLGYACAVTQLLACPFCRDIYTAGEYELCPECEMVLQPFERLPPSFERVEAEAAVWEATPPEDRVLPWMYWGRGRGALILLSVLGIAFFFSPWVQMTMPDDVVLNGYELSRRNVTLLRGGAIAWFVMIPLVATRRSLVRMRGVRIVSAVFASMTLIEILIVVAKSSQTHPYLPLEYQWAWGLYASALVSALGIYFGCRFGGSIDDLPENFGAPKQSIKKTAAGDQLLH